MVNCCVPLCSNNDKSSSRPEKFKSLTGKRRSFHVFPKDEEKKKEWLAKIRRPEGNSFTVTEFTRICSAHFLEDDYKKTCIDLPTNTLKQSAVPSVFKWTKSICVRKPPKVKVIGMIVLPSTQESQCGEQFIIPPPSFEHDYIIKMDTSLEQKNKLLEEKVQQLEEIIKQNSLKRFCLERFSNSDKLIKYYTGFPNYVILKKFFLSIESYIPQMVTWNQRERQSDYSKLKQSFGAKIHPIDQLFMFLNKLRLGTNDLDLADKFLVSKSTVSRNTITWANFLYFILGSQPLWPSKQRVQQCMPKYFQDAYPKTRVVIDSIEIVVQTPSRLSPISELHFNNKGKTIVKGLIGFTPGGAVCFVSNLYSASISDNSLVLSSGILDLLEAGDEVMASKDFLISDVIQDKNCTLVMPNILSSDSKLRHNANIADIEGYLDNVFQHLKQFGLFSSKFPLCTLGSVNQLWTVACLITNFQLLLNSKITVV